jgi:hypothetical protein
MYKIFEKDIPWQLETNTPGNALHQGHMFQNHCVPFPFRDVVLQSGVCVIAHLLASRSLGMRRRSTLLATVKPDDLSNLAPEVRLGLDTCPGFRLGHVAKKHGEISRLMFAGYQIDAITNGVHVATWASKPFQELYDHHIPDWRQDNFAWSCCP